MGYGRSVSKWCILSVILLPFIPQKIACRCLQDCMCRSPLRWPVGLPLMYFLFVSALLFFWVFTDGEF